MFKLENILLLVLVLVCTLVTLSILGAVLGDNLVSVLFEAASEFSSKKEDLPPLNPPEAIPEDGDWQVFRNEGYAFQIHYPQEVVHKSLPDKNSLDAGIEVPENSAVWEFYLNDSKLYEGTNLLDASLVIHVSRGEEAISACKTYKPGSHYQLKDEQLPEVEINGVTFWKDSIDEGVMGGFYQRNSYRTVSNDACYELTELVHSSNYQSLPESTVQPYNNEKVFQHLDQIIGTFSFLDVKPTFPEIIYPAPIQIEGEIQKSLTDNVDGIDVSHWQGDISWNQVAGAGIKFAFVKGTEGVGWTDSEFFTNINRATSKGIYSGVYHFARPDLGNSGQAEAEYFLSVAGDYLESGYLRPVLDLEVRGSLGSSALSAWVLDWMQTVENQTGVAPLLYTNLNYINTYLTNPVTAYDLWIAYWNCDPTITFNIPPTGKWSDWAFWQYCVANPGTVPGISTRIDLNIFNGVYAGLQEYDAASLLWVSIISDTYRAPTPYFADLTIDVNGDTTGLIDYFVWWDCDSLEADVSLVEDSCGVLPQPSQGECTKDEIGMKCLGVSEEVKLAENTYTETGNFTAKAIVNRGGYSAEDRYHITTTNPLQSLTADPVSPGIGVLHEDYAVDVKVSVKSSLNGALQVDLLNYGSSVPLDGACTEVPGDTLSTETFPITVPWSTNGAVSYKIWARFRPGVTCPVSDTDLDDRSLDYTVEWPLIKADKIGFYRPDQQVWHLKDEITDGWENSRSLRFGAINASWMPVVGDWNGSGKDTIAMYSPNRLSFYLKDENTDGWENIQTIRFGVDDANWIPVTGDWFGHGVDTIGLYSQQERTWYLKESNTDGWEDIQVVRFGANDPTWVPVAGDWNGDGQDTIGMYSPGQRAWYLKLENTDGWENFQVIQFGAVDSNLIPAVGDWDGDGIDTIGLYKPGQRTWYLKEQNTDGWVDLWAVKFGAIDYTWKPMVGNWD